MKKHQQTYNSRQIFDFYFIKTAAILVCAVFLMFGFIIEAKAATYYIDNTVTDTNVGSATPDSTVYNHTTFATTGGTDSVLATVADINAFTGLQAGDQVLFRQGQVFRELFTIPASGVEGNRVVFGAYGTGANPVLNGSALLTNASFSVYETIWSITPPSYPVTSITLLGTSATVTTPAPHGLQVGQYVIISGASPAGYNSTGVIIGSVPTPTTFAYVVSAGLDSPATGTITYSIPVSEVWENNVYLTNKASIALCEGTVGTWYWDQTTNTLYVNPSTDPTTNGKTYEVPYLAYGIYDNANNYVEIKNIDAIQSYGSSNAAGTITTNGMSGIYLSGSNNLVHDLAVWNNSRHNFSFYTGAKNNLAYNLTIHDSESTTSVTIYGGAVAGSTTGNILQNSSIYSSEAYVNKDALIVFHGQSSENIIQNCDIYFTNSAAKPAVKMYDPGTTGNIVRWNHFYGTANYSILFNTEGNGAATGNTIEGNLFEGAGGYETIVFSGSGSHYVYNNTIISPVPATNGAAIRLITSTNVIVKNNIIYGGWALRIDATSQTGFISNYNDFYSTGSFKWVWGTTTYTSLADWQTASSQDINSTNADPLFVNSSSDYNLQSASPAKDTGTTIAGYTEDYSGIPVPQFTAPDMGAYEYANTANEITSFDFASPSATGTVNNTNHTVALAVPYATNVASLTPTIAVSTGATISPTSGTAENFTSPVTYTVTAQDGVTTQAYTVTVTSALNPAKAITAFDFNALSPAVIGVVTEGSYTVALTVLYGTAVTALVPTITITGASVSLASGVANNFTSPATYTVTAADSATQAYVVTVTVAADATAPTNGSISINSGATYTNSLDVTLTISATDSDSDVSQMKISEDSGFSGASYETYATSKALTLSSGDGTKTVYIKFKDPAGNESTSTSDTIILDTTAPTVSAGSSQTKSAEFTQTATATDSTSGVNASTYQWSKVSGSGTITFGSATALSTTISVNINDSYVIRFSATDNAGNANTSDFTLTWSVGGGGLPVGVYNSPTAPVGGFKLLINNNAKTTAIQIVTLFLTAGGNTKNLAISNSPDFVNAVQEPYQTTKNWDLCQQRTSCSDGEYTVYAKFYTQYGYSSETVSDSIIYQSARTTTMSGLNKFTKNLSLGTRDSEVVKLKIILSSEGCVSGLSNTDYFGPKTLQAVKCFQNKYKQEISKSAGYSIKSTGFFGLGTRKYINSLFNF